MSKFVKLSSIATLTVGFVGTMAKHYTESGVPLLRSLNIKPFKIVGNDMKYVSAEFSNSISKSILHKGDVIIVRTGIPGTCCVVPAEYDGCNCSDVVIVHPNTSLVDPHYLAAFINVWGQRQVQNNKVGAIQQHFNVHSAEEMLIFLPDLDEQKRIAAVIIALNSKIENNNSVCFELESMAKTIYDYWFTQFDFPDANGKPYRSSGGAMVWNEQLKRSIPSGWKVLSLGNILDLLKDGTHNPPKRHSKGIPLLTGTMFGKTILSSKGVTYIAESDYTSIHANYAPQKSDFIMTKIGSVGSVNILQEDDIPLAIHCNSALIRFKKDIPVSYAFFMLKSTMFQAFLKREISKTVQEFVSLDRLSGISICVPDDEVLSQFANMSDSILNKMILCETENRQLTKLRDWLLPMLMNGQATVK